MTLLAASNVVSGKLYILQGVYRDAFQGWQDEKGLWTDKTKGKDRNELVQTIKQRGGCIRFESKCI